MEREQVLAGLFTAAVILALVGIYFAFVLWPMAAIVVLLCVVGLFSLGFVMFFLYMLYESFYSYLKEKQRRRLWNE